MEGDRSVTVICAWCGVVKSEGDPDRVSHGCCKACADAILAEFQEGSDKGSAEDGDTDEGEKAVDAA